MKFLVYFAFLYAMICSVLSRKKEKNNIPPLLIGMAKKAAFTGFNSPMLKNFGRRLFGRFSRRRRSRKHENDE